MIEGSAIGGESANYSCVPVNAFLQTAKTLETIRSGSAAGVETGRISLNWDKALAFKNRCVENTGVLESAEAFKEAGISLLGGFAQFVDPWTVGVGGRQTTGRNIIIATGSANFIPDIPGLKAAGYITFREALNLPRPPASLLVIGGGTTGCAMAEIFNAAGSRVCLAEKADHLLVREDPEVGQVVEEIFKGKNINVLSSGEITSVRLRDDGQKEAIVKLPEETKTIIVEEILVAAGRLPRLDLNLAGAGIQFDADGIKVNRFLETTANHIYAIGDVIGHDMLAHLSSHHSQLAVHNMNQSRAKDKITLNYAAVSRYLAISPEVAATGLTERELRQQGLPYRKAIVPIHGLIRSQLSGQQAGFVKLICAEDGKLLGGSIVAPEAAEMIVQLSLAVNAGLREADLKNNLKPFTAWSEAFNLACKQLK